MERDLLTDRREAIVIYWLESSDRLAWFDISRDGLSFRSLWIEVMMEPKSEPQSTSLQLTNDDWPSRKIFTVEEANASLVYFRLVVQDITETYRHIIDLRRDLDRDRDDEGKPSLRAEVAYDRAMEKLGELVDELHLAGVELKDFELGIINFPALHQSRDVMLFWQLGDDEVEHWHELDAGTMQLQHVSALAA